MTENLKSAAITALDTVPIIANNAGQGASGYVRAVGAWITPTSAAGVGSTYKLVRIPTTACVKHVLVEGAAETAGSYNIGLNYSDGPLTGAYDGTPVSVAGTVINATLFASAFSFASAVAEPTDVVNQAGNYPVTLRNEPLWQAAGLTADPGGWFDVVLVSTVNDTVGALIGLEVEFVF